MKLSISVIFILVSFGLLAEEFDFGKYEKYRKRTGETSDDYINRANESLFKSEDFRKSCWDLNDTEMFYLYYTVGMNGKAADIKWYPRVSNSDCIEAKIKEHKFPKPTEISYVQLTLWDGG